MMSLSANLKQKQLLCGFIPSKSFLQVSLCHIVYHYPRALPLLGPPGRGVVIILLPRIELLEPLNPLSLSLGARQKPEKPLGEDGGRCPCCYASALVL